MLTSTANRIGHLGFAVAIFTALTCNMRSASPPDPSPMQRELATIDTLLRDSAFAAAMAKTLDSSYYIGMGKIPQPFLTPQEDTAVVAVLARDEKTAISLAGFYGLECGMGMLNAYTGKMPVVLLQEIAAGTIDSNAVLLLNRFANATWKAGQPFRDFGRITRPNFIGAASLIAEEVEKDGVQVRNAARKLLPSMMPVSNSSLYVQMQSLKRLLQDTAYAREMAAFLDSSFAASQHQPLPLSTAAGDSTMLTKRVREVKIATNLAGFYALECGLNYLSTTRHLLPSDVLTQLLNDSLAGEYQLTLARFANATWKAGQPFRGLSRISRSTFTPFYFLTPAEVDKDLVQIRAAARRLLPLL